MENEKAPVEDGKGTETAPNLAGFDSPEKLAKEYEQLKDNYTNLHSKLGQQGSELGKLREDYFKTQGMLEAMKTEKATPAASITLNEISEKVDNGELTYGEGLVLQAKANAKELESRMKTERESILGEINRQQRIQDYLTKHPDYEELYTSGKLGKWISQGMPGEQAYEHFHMEKTKSDLEFTRSDFDKKIQDALERGRQEGLRMAKGEKIATRVIGSPESHLQGGGPAKLPETDEEWTQRGMQLLAKIRSGAGS